MTSKDFVKWLEGYLDDKSQGLDVHQIARINAVIAEISDPIDFTPNPIVPLHPITTPVAPYPPYNPTCPNPYPGIPDVWYTTSDTNNPNSNEVVKEDKAQDETESGQKN